MIPWHEEPWIAYFAPGKQITRATVGWSSEPTELSEVPDPGANWDRSVAVGSVSVTVKVSDDAPDRFDNDWRRRLASRIEDDLKDYRGNTVYYDWRVSDTLYVTVDLHDFDGKGCADASVSVSLSTTTPYGQISPSGSESSRLREVSRVSVRDVVDDAMGDLVDNAKNIIARQQKRPAGSYRADAIYSFEWFLTSLDEKKGR